MRLWSIYPRYLDSRDLVALWREALLAQSVLRCATKGYRRHPQLSRFRAEDDPPAFIAAHLKGVHAESVARGYRFDAGRTASSGPAGQIDVSDGQIAFEWAHLMKKLAVRAPKWREPRSSVATPRPHPLFRAIPGGVAEWERP